MEKNLSETLRVQTAYLIKIRCDSFRGKEGCRKDIFKGEGKNSMKSYKLKVWEWKWLTEQVLKKMQWVRIKETRNTGEEKRVDENTEVVRRRGNCTSPSCPAARALLCEGRGCSYFRPRPPSSLLHAPRHSSELPWPGLCPSFRLRDHCSSVIPAPLLARCLQSPLTTGSFSACL